MRQYQNKHSVLMCSRNDKYTRHVLYLRDSFSQDSDTALHCTVMSDDLSVAVLSDDLGVAGLSEHQSVAVLSDDLGLPDSVIQCGTFYLACGVSVFVSIS